MTSMAAVENILVVRLSSIGDIILTTPVLEQLRRAFPLARIDYCTRAPFVPLLASNPVLSSVYTPENLTDVRHYDLVVDLQNNARSRSMVRGLKSGTVKRYRKQNWKKVLLVRLKINLYGDGYRSVVERYRASLHGLVPDFDAPCVLYPSCEDRAFAAGSVADDGVPVLAVCFGANHFTKRYPAAGFASVISMVTEARPVQVLLLGGKEDLSEAEKILAALSESARRRVRTLVGATSLMQSAALLERSDAVLCNDTGLMHMASAFGKRLFVLFGSSVREFGFLPWQTPFELFETEGLGCRPCSHIGRATCPEGHFRCMNDIKAERIAEKIVETLNRGSR
jgi:heptosyltransferase-2